MGFSAKMVDFSAKFQQNGGFFSQNVSNFMDFQTPEGVWACTTPLGVYLGLAQITVVSQKGVFLLDFGQKSGQKHDF